MSNVENNPAGKAQVNRIAITHDMTIYHALALKDELMGNLKQHTAIELDLSQVAEIDTAGVQLLIVAKRECQKQDKTLSIIAHSPAVHEQMDFYNLAGFFGVELNGEGFGARPIEHGGQLAGPAQLTYLFAGHGPFGCGEYSGCHGNLFRSASGPACGLPSLH